MSPSTLRTETEDGVRSIVRNRAEEYNTITPLLRNELAAAIDDEVHVVLLRADDPFGDYGSGPRG